MPMKLNVGLCKKKGQPDFGSLGASCSVEVELDSFLLRHDLAAFHEHVKNAYAACSQAVNEELTRQRAQTGDTCQTPPQPSAASPARSTANPSSARGNGNGNHNASQKQLDYLQQLARQVKGLGVRRLDELAQRMFSKPLAGVNSLEASSLIDTLKAIKAGQVNLEDILNGAAS